jgi:hypothetical protein
MPQLHFQYDPSEECFLVVAPSGRAYRLRPFEYEQALLQAERLLAGGAQELFLEVPNVMRLRISNCARTTYERTVKCMRETWQHHEDMVLQRYGGNLTAGAYLVNATCAGGGRARPQ